jgi:tungstate transport system substrate-binding protein
MGARATAPTDLFMRRDHRGNTTFRRIQAVAVFALIALTGSGCSGAKDRADTASSAADSSAAPSTVADSAPPAGAATQLVLGSTTSTEDSGLFRVLIPAFERAQPGTSVHVVAVGTGQALELGRRKDADVLLVHAPAAESEFVAKGFGIKRCVVMYNDFVIVGPVTDPAGIKGLKDATDALRRVAQSRALFVSRGDDSGTHKKERALWEEAHIAPSGAWYLQAGQGMAEVLAIASEKSAYTHTDRGTYLAVQDHNALEVLVEGDKRLINQYGVIPVTGARNPAGAEAFAQWITSVQGQQVIGDFGVAKFGRPLFIPNAKGC